MRINRGLLALSAVSIVVGSCSFAVSSKGIAASNQSNLVAQRDERSPRQCKRHHHKRPDFAQAAQKLGVSEAKLKEALGLPPKPPTDAQGRQQRPRIKPDFAGAAQKLGVSEEKLVEALGIPPRPTGDRRSTENRGAQSDRSKDECRGHRRQRPNFAAAAQKLGVSEAKLKEALGLPPKPPTDAQGRPDRPRTRPDFAAAAKRLGVTEEQLVEALGIPPRPTGDNK